MFLNVCSSHEQLPEYFSDTPCKVGTCVHHTKNYEWSTDAPCKTGMYIHPTKSYHGSLLTLVKHENIFW